MNGLKVKVLERIKLVKDVCNRDHEVVAPAGSIWTVSAIGERAGYTMLTVHNELGIEIAVNAEFVEPYENSNLTDDEVQVIDMTRALGELIVEKNRSYGSAFRCCAEFFKILYPNGIAPDRYADALLLVRIFDKMMRIATDANALGESPYQDIASYAILGATRGTR